MPILPPSLLPPLFSFAEPSGPRPESAPGVGAEPRHGLPAPVFLSLISGLPRVPLTIPPQRKPGGGFAVGLRFGRRQLAVEPQSH